MEPSSQLEILMLGNQTALAYLIGRYAQRSGCTVTALRVEPHAAELSARKPVAILFTSVESLEASQGLIAGMANSDIPVLVCSSVADEARARELGADHCLLHPVTYDAFCEALTVSSLVDKTER